MDDADMQSSRQAWEGAGAELADSAPARFGVCDYATPGCTVTVRRFDLTTA